MSNSEAELSRTYVRFTSVQFAHLAFPINFVQAQLFFLFLQKKKENSYICLIHSLFRGIIKSVTAKLHIYSAYFKLIQICFMTLGSLVKTCVGDGLALSACLLCCLWQSVCQTCTMTKPQKCFEGGFSFFF